MDVASDWATESRSRALMPMPALENPLASEVAEPTARRFAALAEPMRFRILDALPVLGEVSVGELATPLGAIHGNASKHELAALGEVERPPALLAGGEAT